MEGKIFKSSLLNSYAAGDVAVANGNIVITGLIKIPTNEYIGVTKVASVAEVPQVVTVSYSANITAETKYQIKLGNTANRRQGAQSQLFAYGTTSPAILTGTPAIDKENVTLAIIAKINKNPENNVLAATLGGGTGFTITDDAGYYYSPTKSTRRGPSTVIATAGFVVGDVAITTPGVVSEGIGANLVRYVPVQELTSGNLAQGTWEFPTNNPPVVGNAYTKYILKSIKNRGGVAASGALSVAECYQTLWLNEGDADYAAVDAAILAL